MEMLVPPQWAQAVVMESVHCRNCGYDLRGLRGDSRCPECGLEIWTSVLHTVDPAASRLPSLRNPRAVGDSLLVLTICMLLGILLLLSDNVGEWLDRAFQSGLRTWSRRLPGLNWISAAILGGAMLLAVRMMAPPRGSDTAGTIWKDIWRVAIGLIGWLMFGAWWATAQNLTGLHGMRQQLALHLAMAVFATIGLIGLRGILNVIGQRSREYRRSRGSRQSVELIIAAVVVGLAAMGVQYLVGRAALPRRWLMPAQAAAWVSNFMIVIGLAYMVLNAWWIRRALRRPPPPLDQVLALQLPPDTWIPDREE